MNSAADTKNTLISSIHVWALNSFIVMSRQTQPCQLHRCQLISPTLTRCYTPIVHYAYSVLNIHRAKPSVFFMYVVNDDRKPRRLLSRLLFIHPIWFVLPLSADWLVLINLSYFVQHPWKTEQTLFARFYILNFCSFCCASSLRMWYLILLSLYSWLLEALCNFLYDVGNLRLFPWTSKSCLHISENCTRERCARC